MEASNHTNNGVITMNAMTTNNGIQNPNGFNLFPPQFSSQSALLFQAVRQDNNNSQYIKEMEEEIAIWIIRLVFLFVFILQLYVNIEYKLPLELLYAPLVMLDGFLIWYSIKKTRVLD